MFQGRMALPDPVAKADGVHQAILVFRVQSEADFSGIGSRGEDLERQIVRSKEHADKLGCRFLFDGGGGGHERAGLMG